MNISGNVILITGGTSGIGRALAEALHGKEIGSSSLDAGRRCLTKSQDAIPGWLVSPWT